MKQVIVAGGGAAGFFAAIACAKNGHRVTILEKSPKLLAKVKISGGGRCNVTHACFDARQLVKNYPRGEKQLLGPFTRFNPANTIEWFKEKGVPLKTEEDGRMFPVTDSSQTIVDCLTSEARSAGVNIVTQNGLEDLRQGANNQWLITDTRKEILEADVVIITTGGSAQIWRVLQKLGHQIVPPVPSLFTFNIDDARIKGLEGLSVPNAAVTVLSNSKSKLIANGPLLVTHWGLSGPAVLRLSAWGARDMAAINHQFEIQVNWLGDKKTNTVVELLKEYKVQHPKKGVAGNPLFEMPKRLWERMVGSATGNQSMNFADLSNKHIEQLSLLLTAMQFKVTGKSTFKDEFVTAGGVDLDELDFKTMQSKKFPGLYFAGEVLDIDAITGGFNFQAAWTTGWIAGNAI